MSEKLTFHVTPLIAQADTETTFTLSYPLAAGEFTSSSAYEVEHFAVEAKGRSNWPVRCGYQVKDGSLIVKIDPCSEQEHELRIYEKTGDKRVCLGKARLYSLGQDLWKRLPFKGDLHMHSFHSDGKDSPAIVASACRKIGLDFMAVTDHQRYFPSLEAQKAFAGVPLDLCIFAGEEVHPPDNPVHIINFGGNSSLNEYAKQNEAAYRKEVADIQKKLSGLPEDVDRFQYASCLWAFEKIRQYKGISIFCHPYWRPNEQYTPDGPLTTALLTNRPFDAFELIGGYPRREIESNLLQVARYHDERLKDGEMAIVGSSDAHGVNTGELFGWYYTIVFSPSLSLQDLKESICNGYSVAVEALPNEFPRAHGPFRMVKFAQFLIREYFPALDTLAAQEGLLMEGYVKQDPSALDRLKECKGQTQNLRNRLWGKA